MAAIKKKYKTFVQRFAAALLDGIIFLPVSLLFSHLADSSQPLTFIFWSFMQTCAWLAYSVYMHGKFGQTLGKMASSVKVFSLDEQNVIGYKNAFMREIITTGITIVGFLYLLLAGTGNNTANEVFNDFINYAVLISTILELVTMFTNRKRRALHDLIAGSVVVDITKYRKWDIEYEESLKDTTGIQ